MIMIDKSGVSHPYLNEKSNIIFSNRRSNNGEVEMTIEDVVREEEFVTVETVIETPNLKKKSAVDEESPNSKPNSEKRGKKVILRKQITIPGKSLAEKLSQSDSPSNGEKIFKTFKRSKSQTKDEGTDGAVETAEEKKKRFREQKKSGSTQGEFNNKINDTINSNEDKNKNNNGNNSDSITSLTPTIAATVRRAGKLFMRSKSVTDILDLPEEELKRREWKEKDGNERVPNKMNKMLVKVKKKWRSYEVEPGQLNLAQFNKMKEQHKEKMKEKRRASLESKMVSRSSTEVVDMIQIYNADEMKRKRVSEEKEIEDLATMATVVEIWQQPDTISDISDTKRGFEQKTKSNEEDNIGNEKRNERDGRAISQIEEFHEKNKDKEENQGQCTLDETQSNILSWDETPVLQIPSAHTYGNARRKKEASSVKKDDIDQDISSKTEDNMSKKDIEQKEKGSNQRENKDARNKDMLEKKHKDKDATNKNASGEKENSNKAFIKMDYNDMTKKDVEQEEEGDNQKEDRQDTTNKTISSGKENSNKAFIKMEDNHRTKKDVEQKEDGSNQREDKDARNKDMLKKKNKDKDATNENVLDEKENSNKAFINTDDNDVIKRDIKMEKEAFIQMKSADTTQENVPEREGISCNKRANDTKKDDIQKKIGAYSTKENEMDHKKENIKHDNNRNFTTTQEHDDTLTLKDMMNNDRNTAKKADNILLKKPLIINAVKERRVKENEIIERNLGDEPKTNSEHREKWNGNIEMPREIVSVSEDDINEMKKDMKETLTAVEKKLRMETGREGEKVNEVNGEHDHRTVLVEFMECGKMDKPAIKPPEGLKMYPEETINQLIEVQKRKGESLVKGRTGKEKTSSQEKVGVTALDVHYVYIPAENSEEMMRIQKKEIVHKQVSEDFTDILDDISVEQENIPEKRYSDEGEQMKVIEGRIEEQQLLDFREAAEKSKKKQNLEKGMKTEIELKMKEQEHLLDRIDTTEENKVKRGEDEHLERNKREAKNTNGKIKEKQREDKLDQEIKDRTEENTPCKKQKNEVLKKHQKNSKSGSPYLIEDVSIMKHLRSKFCDQDYPSRKGTLTRRGSSHTLQPNYDMKQTFLRTENIVAPQVTNETLKVYHQCQEDVDEDEQMHQIITNVQKKTQTRKSEDDIWHLLAAGEQTCNRKNLGRTPKGEPIKGTRTIKSINLETMEGRANDRANESWILIARGNAKDVPHYDEFIEDIDQRAWFSLARGGECHNNRNQTVRKLSLWRGEQEIVASERLTWDIFNMPIQCHEFVRSPVPGDGLFMVVKRETAKAYKLIKSGRVNHVTYCINNVEDEMLNASIYFQDLIEKEHKLYYL